MSDRPHVNYGLCEGGPWHQKHIAGVPAVYAVEIDVITKKPVPGAQPGAPGTKRSGEYRFEGKVWIWHPN